MLDFMLACDLSTLSCTATDIDKEVASFSSSYIRVSDSIWLFKYPSGYHGSFLTPEEYLFLDHFEKFTHDESIIAIIMLQDRHYYNLPEPAHRFLSEE